VIDVTTSIKFTTPLLLVEMSKEEAGLLHHLLQLNLFLHISLLESNSMAFKGSIQIINICLVVPGVV